MKVQFNQLSLLMAMMLALAGCKTLNSRRPIGPHNLPPAQMMMHPGPGVGGPACAERVQRPIPPSAHRSWLVPARISSDSSDRDHSLTDPNDSADEDSPKPA